MPKVAVQGLRAFFAVVIAYAVVHGLVDLALLHTVERRSGVTLRGGWRPAGWIPGHLRIQNVFLEWHDRLRVESGDLEIRSEEPASLLFGKSKIVLSGRKLTVELGKKYAQAASSRRIHVDRVEAVVELAVSGEPVIHSLELESPEIQFHLKER